MNLDYNSIDIEMRTAEKALQDVGQCIAILGSARTKNTHPHYEMARQVAYLFGKNGYGIISGGGYGLMAAANQGAKEANALSVGLHIHIPEFEEKANEYIDLLVEFDYFPIRKMMFMKYSQAFIFAPGGMGTLDELAEIFVHIQTNKLKKSPLIFINKKFWQGFFDWIKACLISEQYLCEEEFDHCYLVDTAEEAFEIVKNNKEGHKVY